MKTRIPYFRHFWNILNKFLKINLNENGKYFFFKKKNIQNCFQFVKIPFFPLEN